MRTFLILPATGLALTFALGPANAVVLEQKWHAGDKAAYALTLNGTMNLQAPADAPVLWAGIPLEVAVHGQGKTVLQTLDVDEDGTARVAFKIARLTIAGDSLGQRGELRVENGTTHLFLNGKALVLDKGPNGAKPAGNAAGANATGPNPTAANRPAPMLANPPVTLRLTRRGKLAGIDKVGAAPAPPPATTDATAGADGKPGTANPTTIQGALNRTALAQAMVLRALPAIWPDHEVNIGDSWDAVVGWPAPVGGDASPLGQFKLTLKSAEIVEGHNIFKVGLEGAIALDQAKIKQVNGAGAVAGAGLGVLTNASQSVKGDLWFDAEAGQVVRAEFVVSAQMAGRGPGTPGHPGEGSWTDFTGTVKLERQTAPDA